MNGCSLLGFLFWLRLWTTSRSSFAFRMSHPKIIKPYVTAFARQVIRTTGAVDLRFVSCTPIQGILYGECFHIVQKHTKTYGGTCVLGWAIWERRKVFIEAELHMVWQAPSGELVDIVPRKLPLPRILFLTDPGRRYHGRQVDNIRKPLVHDKDVDHFLSLFQKRFLLWNKADLAPDNSILFTGEMTRLELEISLLSEKIQKRYGS
jgi:hypothetical protein